MFFSCYALSAIPFGYYSEKIGRFECLKIAVIMSFLGHLLCAIAMTYSQFVLARCLAGTGAGGLILMVRCIQADRFFFKPSLYRDVTVWITIWTGAFSDVSKTLSFQLVTLLPWRYMYLGLCCLSIFAYFIIKQQQTMSGKFLDTVPTQNYYQTFIASLSSPIIWLSIFCYALANGSISLILAEIIMDNHTLDILFPLVAIFFIAGRSINIIISRYLKPIQIISYAILISSCCLTTELFYQETIPPFTWLIPYSMTLGCLLPNAIIFSAGSLGGHGFSVIYSAFSLGSISVIAAMFYLNILFNQAGIYGLCECLLLLCFVISILILYIQFYHKSVTTR
tara:strand:+ start:912 stop:1925 length:1014 start_codon:yes stop_codon:yes gene_type:complete